eukprot:8670772-Pyramimonas_sp.AAC.1
MQNRLHCVSEGAGLVVAVTARDVHAAHDALLAPCFPRLDQVLGRPQHEEESRDHGSPQDRGVRRGKAGLVLQELSRGATRACAVSQAASARSALGPS